MVRKRKKRRNGALDGLRTLSIAAVVLYHLNMSWLPSGHMGVVVFLVLSGYFATNAIVRMCEAQSSRRLLGTLRLFGRRLRRIWPSLLMLVATVGTLCSALDHVLLTKMRPDALPALGLYLNWSYIFNGISYFQKIGGPSPLLHLWYLGVDIQFFLVWAIVLPLLLRGGKRFARIVTVLLAVASAGLMAWLFVPGEDPSRVYYGTDTRAFSLLLGAFVALCLPLGNREAVLRSPFGKQKQRGGHAAPLVRPTILARLVGITCIAAIGAGMVLVPANSTVWYRGGMFGLSVLCALLVATFLAPKTLVAALVGCAPMRVLGQRAFAMYLWHYPIFLLMGAQRSSTVWWMRLGAVGASIVAAELSLRLIERPFGPRRRTKARGGANATGQRSPLVVIPAVALYGLTVYAAYSLQTTPDQTLVPAESLVSTGVAANRAMDLTQVPPPTAQKTKSANGQQEDKNKAQSNADKQQTKANKQTETGKQQKSTSKQSASKKKQGSSTSKKDSSEASTKKTMDVTSSTIVLASTEEVQKGMYDPLLVGDSVPGDAGDEFVPNGLGWESRLPNALIDTFIGRNPSQALEVLRGYLDQNAVGSTVVLACFSNDTPTAQTLDAMVEAAGPSRQVFLVGTVNPDGFQDAANANLQDAANRYENVHYVDWPAVLNGHAEQYLWADATHLRPEGAQEYVNMIVQAIAQSMVDAGGTTQEA